MPKPPAKANPLLRKARQTVERSSKKSSTKASGKPKGSSGKKSGSKPSWMTTGRSAVKTRQDSQKKASQYVPEFWLNDGEYAIVTIHEDLDALTRTIKRHTYPGPTRRGKKSFQSFTCSEDATCEGCKDGNRGSLRWPIILRDWRELEYRDPDDKKRKVKKKGVVKFWLPSVQELDALTAAIEAEREKQEDDGIDANTHTLRVSRTGQGSQTRYSWMVYKPRKEGAVERDMEKVAEFEERYGDIMSICAPLDPKDQRRLIGVRSDDDSDDDDDDPGSPDDDDYDDDTEDYAF